MSAANPTAKRHAILPPISQSGPKPPVTFSSSITISESAVLTGTNPILISSESVIHPRARIDSTGGTVSIGRRCIVHERTRIGHMGSEGQMTLREGDKAVTLEDYVTVEVAAVVEGGGTVLGEGTVVGVASRVGRGAVVGKVCISEYGTSVGSAADMHSTAPLHRKARFLREPGYPTSP